MLRLGAIITALLSFALGLALPGHAWAPWCGVALVVLGGLRLARRTAARRRPLVILGIVLASTSALAAPRLERLDTDGQRLDLRDDAVPVGVRGPVRVTGFFRTEWTMAEYAVPEGALPQQDGPVAAVLVPFVGIGEGTVPLARSLIIARVRPGEEEARGVQTLRGTARELEPELLATFVQASRIPASARLEGVLLDTIEPGWGQGGWLRAGLVVGLLLGGLGCFFVARPEQPGE